MLQQLDLCFGEYLCLLLFVFQQTFYHLKFLEVRVRIACSV